MNAMAPFAGVNAVAALTVLGEAPALAMAEPTKSAGHLDWTAVQRELWTLMRGELRE